MIRFTDKSPVKPIAGVLESYPYHWHDTMEILQVFRGALRLGVGDEELPLREGDVAVVNVGEIHRITGGQPDNLVLSIHVDAGFYRKAVRRYGYSFIYCCSAYHETVVPEKYRTLKEHISRLVKAISDTYSDSVALGESLTPGKGRTPPGVRSSGATDVGGKPGMDGNTGASAYAKVEELLTMLLIHLQANFDFLRWGYGTVPFDDRRVERLRQIADHVTSEQDLAVRLRALAGDTGVSLQYLSNDIKEKFGLTFQELLYYGKCEQAAKALLSTGRRIVDISFECGFSDPKYLIKHFKRVFGCTPSEFRKRYSKDARSLAEEARFSPLPLSEVSICLASMK